MTGKELKKEFQHYPDALNLKELASMFGISTKLASKLINSGKIDAIKIGREYRIAKSNAINFLLNTKQVKKYYYRVKFEPNIVDYVKTL